MADGIADDVVTAACLATSAPVVVAPAMDGDMWTHPATRINVERLRRGSATGSSSPARVRWHRARSASAGSPSSTRIVDAVVAAVGGRPDPPARRRPPARRSSTASARADLEGRQIVVTAGGTAEAIDPVRYIGNRSTGGWASRSPRPRSPVARG